MTQRYPAAKTTRVELVGGPKCGRVVDWPAGARTICVATPEGWQGRYAYCGQDENGKLLAKVIREDR